MSDYNAELHARPSIYFEGPAIVEHVAFLMPQPVGEGVEGSLNDVLDEPADASVRIERHTEFVSVTRLRRLDKPAEEWPALASSEHELAKLAGLEEAVLVCRIGLLVMGEAPAELGPVLAANGFGDTAASQIGGGSAVACSDFRVRGDNSSRILLFNKDLNAHRLGRMVRRLLEIETYRAMALLGLPQARRLNPLLATFDQTLVQLTHRHIAAPVTEHKQLLDEITVLSSQIIRVTAETRNRFGATAAYAQIVEERIALLREAHVPGFQRYGTFVARRFRPAVRTCAATSVRLEQLSNATTHLINLLQTRIQVEIEIQNAAQIQAMADRAATQVRIQRAVEGFSIIAISYYLLGMLKTALEASEHAGIHVDPVVMLVTIPVLLIAVAVAVVRVKHALTGDH
jgi:uncharacterized membrane-anchored protein